MPAPVAIDVFAGWLSARESGSATSFQDLVSSHPSLAAELQALHSAWQGLAVSISLAGPAEPASMTPSAKLSRLATRGSTFARYKIEGEVARGGMGAILRVWDDDLRRRLAMKVALDAGDARDTGTTNSTSPKILARFLEEAQVTGQLDHPGIVPVHEIGLDAQGRLYFTMKLVEGRDLKQIFELVFEGREGWSVTRAVGVLQKACEAVAYAHRKGVIHRDLKPANVMVGSFGEVFVMDWGLARVLGRKDAHELSKPGAPEGARTSKSGSWLVSTERSDLSENASGSALLTAEGDVLGTAAYMPPEQARGEIEHLTPRSDVYSVGAMLYHLLARRPPYFEPGAFHGHHAVLLRVLEGPPRPLASIDPKIAPELAAICEKAMAREPADRYADTLSLAEDLRAYLENRVVAAYETGAIAELKKWVVRNKTLAASVAAGIAILVGGIVLVSAKNAKLAMANSTIESQNRSLVAKTKEAEDNAQRAEIQRVAAETERGKALLEKEKAEKSAEETRLVAEFQSKILSDLSVDEFGHAFLVEQRKDLSENLARIGRTPEEIAATLASFDAAVRPSNGTTVAQRVLETSVFAPAVARVDQEYGATPRLAAMLETPLATTLRNLGLYDLALRSARAAVDARRSALGEQDPGTLSSLEALASVLRSQGKYAEAEPLAREVLDGRRTILGEDHPETLSTLSLLGSLLHAQGKLAEAEPLLRRSYAGLREKLGADHPETLTAIDGLGLLLWTQGKLVEAEPLYREAIASLRKRLGDDHPDTVGTINDLALLLQAQGKAAEAEPLFREALAAHRRKLGDDHPDTLLSINNLAGCIYDLGQITEAETLVREAVAGSRAKLGDDHPRTLAAIQSLSTMLRDQGRLEEAEPLCREVLERSRRTFGEDHPNTLTSTDSLASLFQSQGKAGEAEPLFRKALEGRRRVLGEDHPDTFRSMNNLAVFLELQRRFDEAEPLYREALAGKTKKLGEDHPDTLTSMNNLARMLRVQGRLEESEPLYRKSFEGRRAKFGADHMDTVKAEIGLGMLLTARANFTEAESVLRDALDHAQRSQPKVHVRNGRTALRDLYRVWNGADPDAGHDIQAEEQDALLRQEP